MCGIVKMTQSLLHSTYMHMYRILTRMVRRLFKINSAAFIVLLDKHTFLPTFSTFGLLMSKKDLGLPRWCRGKESTYQCVRCRTQVRSLGQKDPLEEEMATHSSVLVWKIPWTEEPGGSQSRGSQRVAHK